MEREKQREQEPKKTGVLLVLTGKAGAGKDTKFKEALADPDFQKLGFSRIVTCATREPREGEEHGVDYHFISEEEIFALHESNELVEEPVAYGGSYKATPRSEFFKVLEGENKIWRVEAGMAGHVASGKFFEEMQIDSSIKERTVVVFITADDETIENRRKARDGENYDPLEYKKRDEYDKKILSGVEQHFRHFVENPDGENDALEKILEILMPLTQN